MKIIDISWPIFSSMTEYKDRKSVQFAHAKKFAEDQVRETIICMNVHSGTHVDAPAHFLPDGKTLDLVDPGTLMGVCRVIDCTDVQEKITNEDLAKHNLQAGEIILFKTKNSKLAIDAPFNPEFIYLDQMGAQYLVERKVRSVGIDYLGIERNQPDHQTHKTLLGNDIAIIEGVRLEHVSAGNYFLFCLPLSVVGLDAAPARAYLAMD